jgi:hypothetical protein
MVGQGREAGELDYWQLGRHIVLVIISFSLSVSLIRSHGP